MDREKVIKGLLICNSLTDICYNHGCPYYNGVQDICGEIEDVGYSSGDCKEKLHNDAIAMLKEQDALCFALEQANNTNEYLNDVLAKKGVEPKKLVGLIDCSSPWLHYSCGSCKEPLLIRYKFCPHCGKPIKWK